MKKCSFLILVILVILASCNDILEEEPKEIFALGYYNTAEEVEAGVNAIYSKYQDGLYQGFFPAWLECQSDLLLGRPGIDFDYQSLPGFGLQFIENYWGAFYLSIRNANLIIKYAPNGSKISAVDIARYIGEAKFMRALSYFHLVRLWGGIPIRTEINMTESDVPRSNEDEVYRLIIDDLKDAETNLPDEPSAIGRPSKWAAKTLLADVYFYQGLNEEASVKAKEVIQSGKYSLVEVTKWQDFDSKLYGTNVIGGSTESIFSNMNTKSGTELRSTVFIDYNHAAAGYSGGRGDWLVHMDSIIFPVYNNWDNEDIRKDLLYLFDLGLGEGTFLSRKFIDPAAGGGTSGHDFPIYRYADLLLLYAEASCRVNNGPTADGLEALNQVHRRAYGKNPTTQPSDADFKLADYNAQSFVDLVMKERGYETLFEAKRWFDIKRSGKLKEFVKANKNGIVVSDNFLLWPIPNAEMNYNKAIDPTTDQNPGY